MDVQMADGGVEGRFEADSQAFISWLEKWPGVSISSKIKLADLTGVGKGRGVVALENINGGEELFSIPHNAVLSATNVQWPTELQEEVQKLEPWLKVVLALMLEYARGPESTWHPYFNILPNEFDTLIYWSEEELRQLQGSAVVKKIGREQADATFRTQLVDIVAKCEAFSALVDPSPSQTAAEKEDAILGVAHRMASLVMAYAFDLEQNWKDEDVDEEGYVSDDEEARPKGMVPLADMLNADGNCNNARLYHETTGLRMVATQPIAKNDEIFNDYGSLPQSDLLRRYGYTSPEYKSWDVVEVDTATIVETVKRHKSWSETELENRIKLAEEHDVWDDAHDIDRDPNNPYDANMLTTLKYLTCTHVELQRFQAKRKLVTAVDDGFARILLDLLETRQKDYPTDLKQDLQALEENTRRIEALKASADHSDANAGSDIDSSNSLQSLKRQAMAIDVRVADKEILEAAISMLQRKFGPGITKRASRQHESKDSQQHKKQRLR